MRTGFLSAAIIESPNPERLAKFYRDVVGVAVEESHDGGRSVQHYECELGEVHFAIYPLSDDELSSAGSRIRLGFAVASLDQMIESCASCGVAPTKEPVQRGFGRIMSIRDPDGNEIYLTELADEWVRLLQERPEIERSVAFAKTLNDVA